MCTVYNRDDLFEVYELISAQTGLIKSETICGDTDTGTMDLCCWLEISKTNNNILSGN